MTVPKALITIGITITITCHSFFSSLARSRYLSLLTQTLPKLFCFFCLRLQICLYSLPVGRIFFRYFRMSCFDCNIWFCPDTFWVFNLSLISFVLFLPFVLLDLSIVIFLKVFSSYWVPVCFIFLCSCRSFFICPYGHISYSGFVFLFKFLKGIPFSLLASFAPAQINTFSSVMSSVVICCNILFTFAVSIQTCFQSWFLLLFTVYSYH